MLRPQMLIMQSRLNRVETTMFDKDKDLYTNKVSVESQTPKRPTAEVGQDPIRSERFRNTAIATQPSLLTENPPTGLQEPKSSVLYVQSKRDREDDRNSATQTVSSDNFR